VDILGGSAAASACASVSEDTVAAGHIAGSHWEAAAEKRACVGRWDRPRGAGCSADPWSRSVFRAGQGHQQSSYRRGMARAGRVVEVEVEVEIAVEGQSLQARCSGSRARHVTC
jgi:hypothetical protein